MVNLKTFLGDSWRQKKHKDRRHREETMVYFKKIMVLLKMREPEGLWCLTRCFPEVFYKM